MSSIEYPKAHKRAQRTYRRHLAKGTYPYLPALDDLVSFSSIMSEVDLGLVEIPLESVVGTKTAGRKQSFASDFMPLLSEGSEFASKWNALYDAHMEEGIRDPIKAVEFLNRFYVIEGNKRVSVLKYVGAAEVSAQVTRYIPQKSDSLEIQIYFEFLDFYKLNEINYLTFSQLGSYAKLLTLLGKKTDEIWSEDERMDFRSAFIHFMDIYTEKGGKKLSNLTHADAFLLYVEIYGYKGMLEKSYPELREEVSAIWKDFLLYPRKRDVELVAAPTETEEKPLIARLLPKSSAVTRIAFIHDRSPETSSWTYGHELGRHYLEDTFSGRITTSVYNDCGGSEAGMQAIRDAVEKGNTIIFTTSPKLLNASVKAALKYTNVRILNCSMNYNLGHLRTYYGRLYEAKFLTGILAGILSPSSYIGYVADYPIYGAMANINAFAMGVRMVRPDVSICLEWASVKGQQAQAYFEARGVAYVSGQELLSPAKESRKYGLYDIRRDPVVNVAMPIWNWGKFYERILQSILSGAWKKGDTQESSKAINYYWGISSGLIDVICSKHVPAATQQLVELIKRDISVHGYNPFTGVIRSQDGIVRNAADCVLSLEQISSMEWLLDNVQGSLPEFDTMTEEAKQIVALQGVAKYEEHKGKLLL